MSQPAGPPAQTLANARPSPIPEKTVALFQSRALVDLPLEDAERCPSSARDTHVSKAPANVCLGTGYVHELRGLPGPRPGTGPTPRGLIGMSIGRAQGRGT